MLLATRRARGDSKPETFNFLGFTHICGRTRRGTFALQRTTRRDRMQLALRRINEQLHQIRHHAIPQQGARLRTPSATITPPAVLSTNDL